MRQRGTERSSASAERDQRAPEPAVTPSRRGSGYLQRASDAAAGVVDRLRHRTAEPVVQRRTNYSVLKPQLSGQNDVAVLQKDGYHISIVDKKWSYQFDEFHVTEEVGPGRDPHFFFSDTGNYKKKSSWNHGQTINYWEAIGEDEAKFARTENHAKDAAAAFLKDLKDKNTPAEPAAAAPAPAPAKQAPPPAKPAVAPAKQATPAPAQQAAPAPAKQAAPAPAKQAAPAPNAMQPAAPKKDDGWTEVGSGGKKGKRKG